MSWGKYIVNANESITPATFKASDEASNQHNQEVYGLESRIADLDDIISHQVENMENFKYKKDMEILKLQEEIKKLENANETLSFQTSEFANSLNKAETEELSSLNIEQNAEIRQLKLDIKAEREACALICDEHYNAWECAEAIRARGEE